MSKKDKTPMIVKKIQSYKPDVIDYKTQKSFSYSQISLFHTCEYKWKLSNIDKITPYQPSIHTVFGTAIHETIQKYLSIYYSSTLKEASEFKIESYFLTKLRLTYQKEREKIDGKDFTNAEELEEFYEQGIEILKYLKSKVKVYFGKRDYYLIGCEIPLQYYPDKENKYNVFTGYIDLVLYHEPTNTVTLFDLKTSTNGWKDDKKKDILTTSQLLLYKKIFSNIFDFPEDNIEVEYLILKRKLYEDCDFVQKRIQSFKPTQGKIKIKQAYTLFEDFLNSTRTKNSIIKDKQYKQNISSKNCRFCQYNNTKHCIIE